MQPTQRAGAGDPLVLIHGVAGSWRAWDEVIARLAEHFDVLAVALAGHMDAGELPPGVNLSVDSLTSAVAHDMDAAGVAGAHLVGNSLGGWIALELAKQGRARSVVALSPGGGWEPASREEKRVFTLLRQGHAINRWAAPRARAMMRRSLWRRIMYMRAVAHPERMDPELAADAIVAFARSRTPELLDTERGQGGIRDLDQVKCPVLVAWGQKDRMLPRKRYSKAFQAIPDVQMTVLDDVGHVAMWDNPQLVADTVLKFIASHPAHAASAQH